MKAHFPPFGRRATTLESKVIPAHQIESDFCRAICRFTLDCSCGAHHETPFIDEALEWREMHSRLAPIADQLPA